VGAKTIRAEYGLDVILRERAPAKGKDAPFRLHKYLVEVECDAFSRSERILCTEGFYRVCPDQSVIFVSQDANGMYYLEKSEG
jgi:hypothetical protein